METRIRIVLGLVFVILEDNTYMKLALARALGSETHTCAPFLVFRISSDSEAEQSGAHQRRRTVVPKD